MDEQKLIRDLQCGDRDAFNKLVYVFQNKIINIAYGMLSNQDDAIDASQDVFIKVYNNIDSFMGNSSLSTWIYRITVNVCNDYLRKRQRSPKVVSINQSSDDDRNEIKDIPDTKHTPEQITEKTEMQAAIRQAINELSDDYKAVIVMCDLQGMSYEQIADVLDCPTGTVKSRLNRARQALRKKITENKELFL